MNHSTPTSPDEVDILSKEVAALSTKLILAVEKQADLEDGLAAARHELDLAKLQIQALEDEKKEHDRQMDEGLLVERKAVEEETSVLMTRLMNESKARMKAESDRRSIEQEVEDLTRSLFEEANKMVAQARRDKDQLEQRNKQLQNVVMEKDNILASLQEQLTALKSVLQQLTEQEDQDDQEHQEDQEDQEDREDREDTA
ncbi:hypothetical protein V1512DRAFT_268277 [Lipomyces arxii]|uniref:uncharacterized protein n=1 Tax=Lipomyces arxii TaxID=56418 RepID=UPI0034CFFB93